jgi:hypothetical protein
LIEDGWVYDPLYDIFLTICEDLMSIVVLVNTIWVLGLSILFWIDLSSFLQNKHLILSYKPSWCLFLKLSIVGNVLCDNLIIKEWRLLSFIERQWWFLTSSKKAHCIFHIYVSLIPFSKSINLSLTLFKNDQYTLSNVDEQNLKNFLRWISIVKLFQVGKKLMDDVLSVMLDWILVVRSVWASFYACLANRSALSLNLSPECPLTLCIFNMIFFVFIVCIILLTITWLLDLK